MHHLPANMKSFYNKDLSIEDFILEAYIAFWISFKRVLLEELWNATSKLEG